MAGAARRDAVRADRERTLAALPSGAEGVFAEAADVQAEVWGSLVAVARVGESATPAQVLQLASQLAEAIARS